MTSHDDTVYVTVTSGDKFTSYLVRDEIIKEISTRVVSKNTLRLVDCSLIHCCLSCGGKTTVGFVDDLTS